MSNDNVVSSYLRDLPPILWAGEFPLLGQMLRVFEKTLTGIDDDQVVQHGDHTHQAIEDVIAHLDQLFDPWHTPTPFLDWLASNVDLTFPIIRDTQQNQTIQVWDEYLRRKAIAQIVQIYHQRGARAGLKQYLDLYTLAEKRPRIAIDNGSRILFTHPQPNRFAEIATLISQGPYSNNQTPILDGLVAPSCIALAPDGSLIVGDNGTPGWSPTIGAGIWRVTSSGQYTPDASTGKPKRIGTTSFTAPAAIATDNAQPNWHIYVIDNVISNHTATSKTNILYSISSADFTTVTPLATTGGLGSLTYPVAMAFNNGHLFILARGVAADTPAVSSITDVLIDPSSGKATLSGTHILTTVIEPLSLAVLSNGNLLVGDGREQDTIVPADIVLVDRSNNANWVETSQLGAAPAAQNPLIAPVGVVCQDDTHLFVLDLGIKAYIPSLDPVLRQTPFARQMAEPAVIYSLDLTQKQILRVTEQGALVHPTGMIYDKQGMLYIADQGEFADALLAVMPRVWRALPHEFGLAVHFSSQRATTLQDQQQIYQNISDIVNQEKPAHTAWTMLYNV